MKGCVAELKVNDWQMIAWTSRSCDTVKGRRGMADVVDVGVVTATMTLDFAPAYLLTYLFFARKELDSRGL